MGDEFVDGRMDYGALLEEAGSNPVKLGAIVSGIKQRQKDVDQEIKKEITEQNKKITSENWGKVGFDKTVSSRQISLNLGTRLRSRSHSYVDR
jgi:hypothetical protein